MVWYLLENGIQSTVNDNSLQVIDGEGLGHEGVAEALNIAATVSNKTDHTEGPLQYLPYIAWGDRPSPNRHSIRGSELNSFPASLAVTSQHSQGGLIERLRATARAEASRVQRHLQRVTLTDVGRFGSSFVEEASE